MKELDHFPAIESTADDFSMAVDEEEQITPEELLFNEDDLLKALAEDAHLSTTETIEVKFGTALFSFRIRPLTEREWSNCRERCTKYKRNRRLGGMKMPEDTDTVGYHTLLIYTATVEEDRKKLWDNKKFWKATGALTGTDMVDKLIPFAGKKAAIIDRIEKLSGYDDESEEEYEETVKN